MTDEEKRIEIAKACGWTDVCHHGRTANNTPGIFGVRPGKSQWDDGKHEVPDYLKDLNAMHEAEKRLTEDQRRTYAGWLEYGRHCSFQDYQTNSSIFKSVTKTAAQRADAFLQSLGKL